MSNCSIQYFAIGHVMSIIPESISVILILSYWIFIVNNPLYSAVETNLCSVSV